MPAPCLSPYECMPYPSFSLPPHLQLREDGGGDDQGRPLPVCLPGLVVLGPVADDPAASLILDQRAAQPQLTQGALPEGERRGCGVGKHTSPQSEVGGAATVPTHNQSPGPVAGILLPPNFPSLPPPRLPPPFHGHRKLGGWPPRTLHLSGMVLPPPPSGRGPHLSGMHERMAKSR